MKKTLRIQIIILLISIVTIIGSVSYAYLGPVIGLSSKAGVNVRSGTVDNLTFDKCDPISLSANNSNFTLGGNNIEGSTCAKARLEANNETNQKEEKYNVYLDITNNNFEYTAKPITVDTTPTGTITTLITGSNLNVKLKTLAGDQNPGTTTENNSITAIKKANTLDNTKTLEVVSATDSQIPVYMWYEEGTIYYYSEAENIMMNNDSSFAFSELEGLTDISGLQYLNTLYVNNMMYLFFNDISLKNLEPLASWNVGNVERMGYILGADYDERNLSCKKEMSYSDLYPLAEWNTQSVRGLSSAFQCATPVYSLDALKDWNVSNLYNMSCAFRNTGLIYDLLRTEIVNWNVQNVSSFYRAFYGSDKSNVGSEFYARFNFAKRSGRWDENDYITTIPATGRVPVGSAAIIEKKVPEIILQITSPTGEELSRVDGLKHVTYNGISGFDITESKGLITIAEDYQISVDNAANNPKIDEWDIKVILLNLDSDQSINSNKTFEAKVHIQQEKMRTATIVDGRTFNVRMKKLAGTNINPNSNIQRQNMTRDEKIKRFERSYELPRNFEANSENTISTANSISPIYIWFEENAIANNGTGTIYYYTEADYIYLNTNSLGAFVNCSVLEYVPGLADFKADYALNIDSYFMGCDLLKDVSPIENWNVSNIVDMGWMFYACSSLERVDALKSWNTKNLVRTEQMFSRCISLTAVDLGNFNTANLLYIGGMFYNCNKLTLLDLSSFDTGLVRFFQDTSSHYGVFHNCTSLTTILVSKKFVINDGANTLNMFEGCTSLVGGAGTTYDSSKTNGEYARIDGENGLPGYFTLKT